MVDRGGPRGKRSVRRSAASSACVGGPTHKVGRTAVRQKMAWLGFNNAMSITSSVAEMKKCEAPLKYFTGRGGYLDCDRIFGFSRREIINGRSEGGVFTEV